MRGRSDKPLWDLAIFFDVCVTKLEGCSSVCRDRENTACRHRLKANAKILNSSHYIEFLRFKDSQIVLHCFYLASHNRFLKTLAKSGRFVIVTRDQGFLKSAQTEWESRRKKNRYQWPNLVFTPNSVSADGLTVKVHTIKNTKVRLSGHNERFFIINDVNEMIEGLS